MVKDGESIRQQRKNNTKSKLFSERRVLLINRGTFNFNELRLDFGFSELDTYVFIDHLYLLIVCKIRKFL